MRRGLDWYKREPRAFLDGCRAARMTERQVAVYSVILDLIYDHGGETPDDAKHISSYFSDMGTAAARNAIQQLVDIGKIYRVGDMLHQKRAETEAKTRENLSETRAKAGRFGGISSGNSRRQHNENNDISEASASSKNEADIEKRREEDMGKPISPSDKPPAKARMPVGWMLSDEGWAYARSQGIPDKVIEDEARGFQAYWADRRDRDASKSERGWEQCWANRCRSIAGRYSGRIVAGGPASGRYGQGSSIASIVARRRADGEV